MMTAAQNPRRILMTADPIGGIWSYALELARYLESQEVIVCLATMGAPLAADQRREAARLSNLLLYERDFRLEWMREPWEDIRRAGDWLRELEARFQPDLVHLNEYAHGALPWSVPCLVVGHSCALSRWRALKKESPPPTWDHYESIVRAGVRNAQWVVAPSVAMLAAMVEFYGPLAGMEVIPHGRRPEPYRSCGKEDIVFAAGRLWDEAKNLQKVTEVAAHLPWPVWVAGERAGPDETVQFSTKAHLLGRCSAVEMAAWYGRARIYVHPALYEPFGLSILEAALAECCLVLGDIPSIRELWEGAAEFVPPGDAECLRDTLVRLMRDRRHQEELARRARVRGLDFSATRMGERYLFRYRSLAVNRISVMECVR